MADPGDARLARLLDTAATAGLDTVITKAEAVTPALATAVHRRGLRLLGSVACFRGPDGPVPVGDDGLPWRRMEWYDGVRPNDPDWNAALAARCAGLARTPGIDGLVLDFLRWPLHWELELRPGARPRSASYDDATLTQFAAHSGLHLTVSGAQAARLIAHEHAAAWTRYRTHTVTAVTHDICEAVHAARPGLWLGAFLVPADSEEERRRLVGQDGTGLGALLDGLLPMTYHAILHRTPAWVADVTRELARASAAPVTPMVQSSTDAAALSGGDADWGKPFGAEEFTAALRHALHAGQGRLCLFPGEGLGPTHWSAVRTELDAWSPAQSTATQPAAGRRPTEETERA